MKESNKYIQTEKNNSWAGLLLPSSLLSVTPSFTVIVSTCVGVVCQLPPVASTQTSPAQTGGHSGWTQLVSTQDTSEWKEPAEQMKVSVTLGLIYLLVCVHGRTTTTGSSWQILHRN